LETIKGFSKLWPEASLSGLSLKQSKYLSWWLSGLVTVADWIGSNTEWFKPEGANCSLQDYLESRRPIAEEAVNKSGIIPPDITETSIFESDGDFLPRPMQSTCLDVSLTDDPMLVIIEDETGAGKTEAAMMLAQRMLLAGKGQGSYFALPTMATADAMFSRVSEQIGKIFRSPPTITLAHGRAGLSEDFIDIQQGRPNAPEDIGCTEWLSDHRRRSLLANVGVGTIDQALLSVLPVKFQTLRHFGLASKILVVDEAHELGEAYIATILKNLLELHRQAGGSAILLTATLPLSLRQELMEVYEGEDDGDPSYPSLTVAGGEAHRDFSQETNAKGVVRVERLTTSDEALHLIKEKTAQGASCVWVRNAVDDAIAAVKALREEGIEADLLHARYCLGDRKRIEENVRSIFGKNGNRREGRVLVGTQILESSLDLDFDVMVSDLAPMAGLIQRAGRLWRHMDLRPACQRPVAEPVLYVLSPDPDQVDDQYWLNKTLESGAYVYPHDLMWRTAYYIFEKGEIIAPSGIRNLIEKSYGDDLATPHHLEKSELDRIGKDASHGAIAHQNTVNIDQGYRKGGLDHDDAKYPTRLGEEQITLVLARFEGDQLAPYFGAANEWAMSEVSVAKKKIEKLNISLPDQEGDLIATITSDWPKWKKYSYRLCPVAADGQICDGLYYDPDLGLLLSHANSPEG